MAGGANLGDEDETITDINVTPFVDVMLVLLIIFMVTANYINSHAINVNLPKAASGESPDATESLGFSLNEKAELFLDGEAIDYAELKEIIEKKRSNGENLQALIAADLKTPHGDVVKLIDEIRKNGITDFAINVEVEVDVPQ